MTDEIEKTAAKEQEDRVRDKLAMGVLLALGFSLIGLKFGLALCSARIGDKFASAIQQGEAFGAMGVCQLYDF